MMAGYDPARITHLKSGIKIVLLLGTLIATMIGQRKAKQDKTVSTDLAHSAGGLTLINITIVLHYTASKHRKTVHRTHHRLAFTIFTSHCLTSKGHSTYLLPEANANRC